MVINTDTTPTFKEVQDIAQTFAGIGESKGYHSIRLEVDFNDVLNDTIYVRFSMHDQDWSSVTPPIDIPRKCGVNTLGNVLNAINRWINKLDDEHIERERQLVRDYARIKERIAASNLSDVVKAEAETLMRQLTENILMPPEEGYATEAQVEQIASQGPSD